MIILPPKNIPPSYNMFIEPKAFSSYKTNEIERSTGLKINPKGVNGWIRLIEDIDYHQDYDGPCCIGVCAGVGILWVENHPIHLSKGFFTLFNDSTPHAFELLSRSCTMMVFNYSGKIWPELTGCFLK